MTIVCCCCSGGDGVQGGASGWSEVGTDGRLCVYMCVVCRREAVTNNDPSFSCPRTRSTSHLQPLLRCFSAVPKTCNSR